MFFKKYLCHILFFTISVVLTIIWFHSGSIIALGESGIPFYDLGNVFKFYGHAWSPVALGFYPGSGLTEYTFFGLGIPLYILHFPGFLIQALFFFFLLLGIFEGAYFFFTSKVKGYFPNDLSFVLVSSLFYGFNLISL